MEASQDRFFERAIGLAVVGVLVVACFAIAKPFIGATLWGVIIAVSTWSIHRRLERMLGNRRRTAAVIMTFGLILLFVVPVVLLGATLADAIGSLGSAADDLAGFVAPTPPEWVTSLPFVGERIVAVWTDAAADISGTLQKLQPWIVSFVMWVLQQGAGLGFAVLEFMIASIIAGILYVSGEGAADFVRHFVRRIFGDARVALIDVAGRTIRGVAQGVIGTAVLQGALATFGFFLSGAPAATLLGFLTFLFSILQLPTIVVWVPAAIWLYYSGETEWAIFLAAWGLLVVNTVDNVLRPILITSGAKVPLLVVFVGVLGGLIAFGLIGIFVGATILAVCWTLTAAWVELETRDAGPPAAIPPG